MAFTAELKKERQGVIDAALSARTLAEVRAAGASLSAWMVSHPEDVGILDVGESLSHAKDYAELRDTERRLFGFSEPEGLERERVFVQAERAHDVPEVAYARRELLLWRWAHACDAERVDSLLRHLNDKEMLAQVIAREIAVLEADPATAANVITTAEATSPSVAANQSQAVAVS